MVTSNQKWVVSPGMGCQLY